MKFVIAGEANVGKSSLVKGIVPNFKSGSRFCSGEFLTNRGTIPFQITLTRGGDDLAYLNADGIILAYDTTREETSYYFKDRVVEIERVCGKVPTVICGTKIDESVVGHRMYSSLGYKQYSTSAVLDYGLKLPFEHLMSKILDTKIEIDQVIDSNNRTTC